MRKQAWQIGDAIEEERRRSKLPTIFFVLFLVGGLVPIVVEGGAICLANWKEVMGVSSDVRTPVIDSVHDNLQSFSDTFWYQITPYFRRLPWDPKMVLPAAAIIMAVAMFMLRR
jgi:hypothetical protein